MAEGLNKVMLIGNLGRDPEMRFTANGNATTGFSLAVTRSYGAGSDRKEETEWVPIVTWSKLAELCGEHLAKGRRVFVEGRLATRSWEGPDGQKKYRTEVVADKVLFMDNKGTSGEQPYHGLGMPPGDDPVDADDLPFE